MTVGLLSFAVPPQSNAGRAQINLYTPSGPFDFWSLNACKMCNGFVGSGASDTAWPALLNSDGYPTALPNGGGAKWASSQLYIYGVAADVWVLDWSGTATVTLAASGWSAGTLPESIINSNRREYTITGLAADSQTGSGLLVSLQITAITSTPSNIRLYRKADETLINGSGATSLFHPEWLGRVKDFGVLRFMDWNNCNGSRLYDWTYIRSETNFNWCAQTTKSAFHYGTATVSKNAYTVSSLPTLTNGLPVQFYMPTRPAPLTISATVTGSPTTFTITAHGLSNGDLVTLDLDSTVASQWTTPLSAKVVATGLPPDFSVTVSDANTITIPLDSTGFSAPSGTFRLFAAVKITDGTTTKRCYRKGLTHYFNSEFSANFAGGGLMTAVYDSTFGVFVMSGDGGGNVFDTGLPPSVLVTLANYSGAHPWFTYPYTCVDNFWTQLATYVRANLRPGLTPRFESGNEIWNTGDAFWQTSYAQSIAAKTWGTAIGTTGWDLAYGYRAGQVSDAIKAVYGSGTSWVMALGAQGGSSSPTPTNRLQGNAAINGGTSAGYPLNKCDVVAFAPYIVPLYAGSGVNAAGYGGLVDAVDSYNQADTTTAFNWFKAEMSTPSHPGYSGATHTNEQIDGWITTHTANWTSNLSGYSGRNGLSLMHYEGGNGVSPANISSTGFPATATSGRTVAYSDFQTCFLAFLASSQMGDVMKSYLARSSSAGVNYPSQYVVATFWTINFVWGMFKLDDVYTNTPTPWYTAAYNWNVGLN